MGQEVEGDSLGDEYKGYIFKITGGNDKDGFPMRQGVMVKVTIFNREFNNFREELESYQTRTKSVIDQEEPEKEEESPSEGASQGMTWLSYPYPSPKREKTIFQDSPTPTSQDIWDQREPTKLENYSP